MKYLRAFLLAAITFLTFGSAMAQVVVKARIGNDRDHHRNWHHRHYRHHDYRQHDYRR